jgi:hypothetical protein
MDGRKVRFTKTRVISSGMMFTSCHMKICPFLPILLERADMVP